MKKEITVNSGGKVEQTIIHTEVNKEPPSVSVGPITVAHDNMVVIIVLVVVAAAALYIGRKSLKRMLKK
mgnify:FL=1|tara:strand:- start:994 stop:1200 length:207 start_codon:yes stop_codon:yes gene_type:complete